LKAASTIDPEVFMQIRSLALIVALFCLPAFDGALESTSTPLAKELVALLDQRKLQNVAAKLPGGTDRFAAVMYIPNSELLAVSARYTVPVLVQEQIYSRKYREAYLALNQAGSREGKLFVEDLGADGLQARPDQNGRFDIVYQEIARRTLLNGDWKGQGLSEKDYRARFLAADESYATALTALLEELKKLE